MPMTSSAETLGREPDSIESVLPNEEPPAPKFKASDVIEEVTKKLASVVNTQIDEAFCSAETEFFLLAALVAEPELYDEYESRLSPGLFYFTDAVYLLEGIVSLNESGRRVSLPVLREKLRELEYTEVNFDRFQQIVKDYGHQAEDVPEFLFLLERLRTQRESISVLTSGLNILQNRTKPDGVHELVQNTVESLEKVLSGTQGQAKTLDTLTSYMSTAIEQIDERYHSPDAIPGIPTSLDDLDEAISGLMPGDLIVVGARPAMGKTAFALTVSTHAGNLNSLKDAASVYFSAEVGGTSLALRALSGYGRIDSTRLRSGKLEDNDWHGLTLAVQTNQNSTLYIDERANLTLSHIRSTIKKLKRKHGRLGLITIDYLGLMESDVGSKAFKPQRSEFLSEITRQLKQIARIYKVPIMLLSQLNRALEQRPNKRPMPSDLRESGAIEQDADIILFLYRDEVYNPDTVDRGVAEIIIGKNRNGPTKTIRTKYIGEYTKFENYYPNEF